MQVDQTTQPLPPLGVSTTPTPLSVEGTTNYSDRPDSLNVQKDVLLKNSIYYGKYSISRDDPTGKVIWKYRTDFPLGEVDNNYYTQVDSLGNFRMLLTKPLVNAYFSRSIKIDWVMIHQPVKISDCRVSCDMITRYSGSYSSKPYRTDTFVNDNVQVYFDDMDDHFIFQVPSFWPTSCVATRNTRQSGFNRPPPFVPKTTCEFFIRSPYVNNALQPDTFDVLVYLVPIISHASTIAAQEAIIRYQPDLDDFLPLPYIYNRKAV